MRSPVPGVTWMFPAMFESISVAPLPTGNARENGSVDSTQPSGIRRLSRSRGFWRGSRGGTGGTGGTGNCSAIMRSGFRQSSDHACLKSLLVELAFQMLHLFLE